MNLEKIIFRNAEIMQINTLFRILNRKKVIFLMYHGVVPDNYQIDSWLLVKESEFIKRPSLSHT